MGGRHQLNQGTKPPIPDNGTKQCHVPPDVKHQGGHNLSTATILPKRKTYMRS